MQRTGIPETIIAARLINAASGKELALKTRSGSCCHFVERFSHGKYEIGLRIDWSDMDRSGDPTLDADFFTPGDTKPLREPQFKQVHHTRKAWDVAVELWVYDFDFDDLSLRLLLELTRQRTITGTARIVPPDQKRA